MDQTGQTIGVYMPPEIKELGVKRSAELGVSFSKYVTRVVTDDLISAGYLASNSQDEAKVVVMLHEAMRVHGADEVLKTLQQMLKDSEREVVNG